VIFVGELTVGAQVKAESGKLSVIKEGRKKKYIDNVEQITFSGEYAKETGQEVLFVTERAVFEMGKEGVTLIEIAPGLDLNRDVLDQMEFKPLISANLHEMDPRIFVDAKMLINDESYQKTKVAKPDETYSLYKHELKDVA